MGQVPIASEEQIKSLFCFAIAPDMKRRGIATLLLDRVFQDAALDGFHFVEAYPRKSPNDENTNHNGSIEMYRKGGFTVHCETDNMFIMRKQLGCRS